MNVESQERERKWRRRDRTAVPKQIVLILAALAILLPGYFLLITPFKTQAGYSLSKLGFPRPIYLGNFVTALRGGRFFLIARREHNDQR